MTKVVTVISLFLFTTLFACAQKQTKIAETNETSVAVKKQSISKVLSDNENISIKERVALYLKLKKEQPDTYNFENEDELTMYGYRHLWDNKTQDAIEVFKLIASQFPNSSNAYDSLGEGYFVIGNFDLALQNYEKSLAMNPQNFNAEDMIERIKFPDRKPLTPKEKFEKIYAVEAYKSDLDQLGKKLLEVHPNALKFISEKAFWNSVEEKKSLIMAQTTYAEFVWHCKEIIANVNCSHTYNSDFFDEWEMLPQPLEFPLEVRWINNALVVVDSGENAEKVSVKDEIASINGIEVSKLMKDIYKTIPSQGHIETYKKHQFNSWASSMLSYTLNFPETYEVQIKGKQKPFVLNPSKKQIDFKEPFKRHCPDNLCVDFLNEDKIAILTISSFNYYPWNNLDVFEKFIDKSFKEIQEKGTNNLIIDLRFNGGGSPESSIYLLKHLLQKPFDYFLESDYSSGKRIHKPFANNYRGKLYFLIDGNGNSTTGHFMAIAKDLNLGKIIGEELGSNHFCTAGQTLCRLTNTKFQYYVANSTSQVKVNNLPDNRGIFPDYEVQQTIDDYLGNVDTVKKFTLELIQKNQ